MTDERYAELQAMPKYLRLKTWTDAERAAYMERVRAETQAKHDRREARKNAETRRVKAYRPRHKYDGHRPTRNGPTYYGSTQIWDD